MSLNKAASLFALTTALALWSVAVNGQSRDPSSATQVAQADHGDEGHAHDDAAAHGAHEGGRPEPLKVDPDLGIFTGIVFVLLLLVLAKFAWRPIIDGLNARESHIADEITEAERRHEEAKALLAQHRSQLEGAADEVRQLLEQGKRDAEATKQEIISEAQAAAARERERAVAEIEAAKSQALQELARTSADTAVALAGQIVRREMKPEDHSQLIAEAMEKFPVNS